MAKLIHISDDVYNTLKKLKGRESYSQVIRALAGRRTNKQNVLAFFGKGGVDAKKVKGLRGLWKEWSGRYV